MRRADVHVPSCMYLPPVFECRSQGVSEPPAWKQMSGITHSNHKRQGCGWRQACNCKGDARPIQRKAHYHLIQYEIYAKEKNQHNLMPANDVPQSHPAKLWALFLFFGGGEWWQSNASDPRRWAGPQRRRLTLGMVCAGIQRLTALISWNVKCVGFSAASGNKSVAVSQLCYFHQQVSLTSTAPEYCPQPRLQRRHVTSPENHFLDKNSERSCAGSGPLRNISLCRLGLHVGDHFHWDRFNSSQLSSY